MSSLKKIFSVLMSPTETWRKTVAKKYQLSRLLLYPQQVSSTSSVSGPAVASTSSNNEEEVSISSPTVRPEDISPFPKAGPRKIKGGRKKGKSLILTDTPVKEQLRAAQENRKQNKGKAKPKSGSKPKKLKLNGEDGKRKTEDDGDSENGEHEEWLASDHDQASECDEHEEQQMDLPEADDLKPDDFVLVKFSTKKNQVL